LLIQELRDLFIAQYKVESIKQKFQPIDFNDKLIVFWISSAKNDILGRLKITKTFRDLVLPMGENLLSLPHNFGSVISCECGGLPLTKVSADDIKTTGTATTGIPQKYAIFNNGEELNILFSPDASQETTVRLWYNLSSRLHSPRNDGSMPKEDLDLPSEYIQPILYYMLDQSIGGDFKAKYEVEIAKLRQLGAANSSDEKIPYVMN
jgi:hypothetical protein